MPRKDGTGPMGMGPLTGRGAGCCTGYASNNFTCRRTEVCSGIGAGRGYRRMYYLTGLPRWARSGYNTVDADKQTVDEKTVLKNEEKYLESQLQQVKERLKDIDEKK